MRGKSIKKVTTTICITEKTLNDAIQNGRISDDRLFQLTAVLDIDINWMGVHLVFLDALSF